MIIGKKVKLRDLEVSDAKQYYDFINDQETNYWRGVYPPISTEKAATWIKEESLGNSSKITLAILNKSNELIGFAGLRGICQRSRRAEYWIYIGKKSAWNKGYGLDATRTLIDFGFNQMNLHRIWLECDPKHVGAVKIYKKAGFKLEGILRDAYFQHGAYRNSCIMSALASE